MAKKRAMLDTVYLDEAPSKGFVITHHHEVIIIFIIFALFFCVFTKKQAGSWNDQSRFATIEALVENPDSMPRFAIDYTTYGWWTGDKIFDDEHFYSTKPPVLSVLGAGIYYFLHDWFQMDYSNPAHEKTIYFIITFLLIGLPTAAALALFFDLMRRMGLKKKHAIFLTLSVGIGSLMLPYSLVFNNHTLAGAAIFVSFYFLYKAIEHNGSRGWNLFFSGLLSGFALTVDIAGAGPFAAAFMVYTLTMGINRRWHRHVRLFGVALFGSFLLGFLVFVLIHLYFNYQITGDLKPIYAKQVLYNKLAVEGYYGEVISSKEGLFSEGRFRYIVNSLVGIRGIFLYTPLLLFSFYFMIKVALDKRNRLAFLSKLILFFLIPSWIYLLLATKNYGGTSYGSRYFVASMPMLFFFNAFLFRYATSDRIKGWFYEGFRLSVLLAVIGMAFPWGVAGQLPPSNFSIFNNLQYWTQNFLMVLAEIVS